MPRYTVNNFQQFVNHLRVEKSYELTNILNMDETPVWFDMAGNFTIDKVGEKRFIFAVREMKKTDLQLF